MIGTLLFCRGSIPQSSRKVTVELIVQSIRSRTSITSALATSESTLTRGIEASSNLQFFHDKEALLPFIRDCNRTDYDFVPMRRFLRSNWMLYVKLNLRTQVKAIAGSSFSQVIRACCSRYMDSSTQHAHERSIHHHYRISNKELSTYTTLSLSLFSKHFVCHSWWTRWYT